MILHEKLAEYEKDGMLEVDVPSHVADNLSPGIGLRPYQRQAISRFVWKMSRERTGPEHLLFHMATGSGKTVIMASAMLHLWTQGYRNFLFFVNSSQIVEKTKANFINSASSKYLFAPAVRMGDDNIPVQDVTNFDAAVPDAINIVFTTIQGLHTVLNNPKENGLTFEDFEERRVVMISDEAHHINALTKSRLTQTEEEEEKSWEHTVRKVLRQHPENVLLEFSATVDMDHSGIAAKYSDKMIIDYPLRSFRADGYSKDIELRQAEVSVEDRMLQAIVLSEYRRALARDLLGEDWKPVVLMKSATIKESKVNQETFRDLIDHLQADRLQELYTSATGADPVDQTLINAFDALAPADTYENLVLALRSQFSEARTTNVNEPDDLGRQQILLNSLEDPGNPIRCIFAVNKLDEGWDVLNLFDVVRLSEKAGSGKKPSETTMREAQLIGRGARYFPFADPEDDEKPAGLRKYDDDHGSQLRLLEQMHYHCTHELKYVSDLKKALVITGALTEGEKVVELKVKQSFKDTEVFQGYCLWANKRVPVDKATRSVSDVLSERTFFVDLPSGYSGRAMETGAFDAEGDAKGPVLDASAAEDELKLSEIGYPVLRRACDEIESFRLAELRQAFPKLQSLRRFLLDADGLGELKITVRGPQERLSRLSPSDALHVARAVLSAIANDVRRAQATHQGSKEFFPKRISGILKDRVLKLSVPGETMKSWQESDVASTRGVNLANADWHVFDDCYGTSEEKEFVAFIASMQSDIAKAFDEFFVIRNEKMIKLHEIGGDRATEPDYILLMRRKGSAPLCRQVFIEPKGDRGWDSEAWKSKFLEAIGWDADNGGDLAAPEPHEIRGLPFFGAEPTRRKAFKDAFEVQLAVSETS
ncbi:DEAD/DEAH box helicase family protein [Pseudoroseicyclus tamaricis]|uniref:DEAD/DEAH box helicase family protein n=1 Tax=Pseudoroseicyclus tamaricis TaxID=2705421 RepID=A0A6B2JP79_9RHOB|nr:DEAD/DEAH box helicase family protein [Pseudoroseicyclus tamaricis]NDU99877.1 DEAD/DEAH box helicase family protein [Pseudoroseicyclus tamaricis]